MYTQLRIIRHQKKASTMQVRDQNKKKKKLVEKKTLKAYQYCS